MPNGLYLCVVKNVYIVRNDVFVPHPVLSIRSCGNRQFPTDQLRDSIICVHSELPKKKKTKNKTKEKKKKKKNSKQKEHYNIRAVARRGTAIMSTPCTQSCWRTSGQLLYHMWASWRVQNSNTTNAMLSGKYPSTVSICKARESTSQQSRSVRQDKVPVNSRDL